MNRRQIILIKKKNLKKLRGRGYKLSMKAIAKLCGVSEFTTWKRLKEYKIK